MGSRGHLASLLAGGLGFFSAVAAAEPSAADRSTARGLMAEGRLDRDNGDPQDALRAFADADAIMHVPTTGLEVAKTQAALGLLLEAWGTALRVSRIADEPGEPAPFKVARDAARALKGALEDRIPSLTVTVKKAPQGLSAAVTLDDVPLAPEALGQPRKVDPGHHVLVATAGGADRAQAIDLAEKDEKEVTLALPASGASATMRENGATPTGGPPAPGPTAIASHRSGASPALVLGGFGFAGLSVLAGAAAGVVSLAKTDAIERSTGCAGTVCGPAEYADIRAARSMATFSTVSFVVAGVGAALGVLGLVTGNSRSSPPEQSTHGDDRSPLAPWLGPRGAGVRGTF